MSGDKKTTQPASAPKPTATSAPKPVLKSAPDFAPKPAPKDVPESAPKTPPAPKPTPPPKQDYMGELWDTIMTYGSPSLFYKGGVYFCIIHLWEEEGINLDVEGKSKKSEDKNASMTKAMKIAIDNARTAISRMKGGA